jgi:hypothetical protein
MAGGMAKRLFIGASLAAMVAGIAMAAAFHLLTGAVPRPVMVLFLGGIGAGLIGAALRDRDLGWITTGGVSVRRARSPRVFAFHVWGIRFGGGLAMLGLALYVLLGGPLADDAPP